MSVINPTRSHCCCLGLDFPDYFPTSDVSERETESDRERESDRQPDRQRDRQKVRHFPTQTASHQVMGLRSSSQHGGLLIIYLRQVNRQQPKQITMPGKVGKKCIRKSTLYDISSLGLIKYLRMCVCAVLLLKLIPIWILSLSVSLCAIQLGDACSAIKCKGYLSVYLSGSFWSKSWISMTLLSRFVRDCDQKSKKEKVYWML